MLSYLRYPILVALWVVALMSGAFSLFREIYGIYKGVIPARSLFWSCTWIAFVVSASILWIIEHRERIVVEKRSGNAAPRLMLSVTSVPSSGWDENTCVFFVQNYGLRPATFVKFDRVMSAARKYTLELWPLPSNEVILPNARPMVGFKVHEYASVWSQHAEDISQTVGMLIKFFNDGGDNQGPPYNRGLEVVMRFKDGEEELINKLALCWESWSKVVSVEPYQEGKKKRGWFATRLRRYIKELMESD